MFVEAIGCETVHFLKSLTGGGIFGEFFCYGPRGRMNTLLFLSKLIGIARRGDLKELEVCDFGQYINEMMAIVVYNFQNF